jgi:adhesin/invasin
VLIFATGLGATSPAVLAGAAAPASPGLSKTVETVTVTIGGSNAPVSFSGLAPGFAGLYQINAVIPPSVSGIVDVLVTAGAVTSCSCATVQIQ